MMDRRSALQLLAWTGLWACGPEAIPDPAEPKVERIRDAHALAAQAVKARVTMIIYMDRVRKHALAPKLAALDVVSDTFDGTDIDPLEDVDRAVIAARTARSQKDAIAVAEHHVEPARLKASMTKMVEASGDEGRWLTGYPFDAAKVVVRKRKTVVMAVTPTLFVVTSPKHVRRAATLHESGGIPNPTNPAAIVADANQPSSSLKARRVPPVPKTVNHLYAELVLRDDGGADLAIDGESSSVDQARADATKLTEDIDKASNVNLGFFKFKAFEPIVFKPDGNMVRARRRVSKKELDALLSLASMMMG